MESYHHHAVCACVIPAPPFIIFQIDGTESVNSVALCSADLGNPVSVELSALFSHLLLLAFVSIAVGDCLRSRSVKTGAFL